MAEYLVIRVAKGYRATSYKDRIERAIADRSRRTYTLKQAKEVARNRSLGKHPGRATDPSGLSYLVVTAHSGRVIARFTNGTNTKR